MFDCLVMPESIRTINGTKQQFKYDMYKEQAHAALFLTIDDFSQK